MTDSGIPAAPRVLIVAATSAIAEQVARRAAQQGAQLVITARDIARLADIAADLRLRGAAAVVALPLDILDAGAQAAVLDAAWQAAGGGIDLALLAPGSLSDEDRARHDMAYLAAELQLNAVATIQLAAQLVARFEAQGHGRLGVLSSVAGERGRASNYAYGAAKAAVTAYLSGLRQRLHGSRVSVLTIKPGLVDTPMTRHFPKGPLWASPQRVGDDIWRALQGRKATLCTPWPWAVVAWALRALPHAVFERFGPR